MVTAAASLILIGITISSLISFQQMSQGLDDKLKQEAEIERALHFIAADIQEGKLIKPGAPAGSSRRDLFHVIRPDNSTIEYYTITRGSRPWSGPAIIYRNDSTRTEINEDEPSASNSYALIDQISKSNPTKCIATGTKYSRGFSISIDGQSRATVCIRGNLRDSPDGIEGLIQATTRVQP